MLLDTHVLIWLVMEEQRLGGRARDLIGAAAAKDALYVSPISFWEVSMLAAKNRLVVGRPIGGWVDDVLALPGIVSTPLTPAIAVEAGSLPPPLHGDRLIVATARALDCLLLTADGKILRYAAAGHLTAEDARA